MLRSSCPPFSRQGHNLEHKGWVNPVRWRDIYGNFSQLQPDIPVLWGTVEDSVDRMNEIGIKPLGNPPELTPVQRTT